MCSDVGWDDLRPGTRKLIQNYIKSPLSHICNHSLVGGIFPSGLKIANAGPIFKPGDDIIFSKLQGCFCVHDDVIKWEHFPRYWPFVRGIHRSPVNSPHKGQWHGALMFSLVCAWTNGWVNYRDAVDLRRHRAHYHDTAMLLVLS